MKKETLRILYILGFSIALIVGAFYAFNAYIYNQKQGDGSSPEPYRASLQGEYVCIVEKEDACETYGLRTQEKELYAIDFMLMSQIPPALIIGDEIRANGVVVAKESYNTEFLNMHNAQGSFSVTDSVQVLQ